MGLFGFGKRRKQIIEYLEQAEAAVQSEQYDDALAIYQKLLRMEYWEARGLMGDVYRAMGDVDKMKRMYYDGARCSVSTMSPASLRGYAECLIRGFGFKQDLKQAKTSIGYLEKAEDGLISDAAREDAARKRAALKRMYQEEYDRQREQEKELERQKDELSGRAPVRRIVEAAPRDLIKGTHAFRMSTFNINNDQYASSLLYRIAKEDVALTINTALREHQTHQEGFTFTTYGVASHYFISIRAGLGKSNFAAECIATLPFRHMTAVKAQDDYIVCTYSDRKTIIALAGDHTAWLCHILQQLIDTGYAETAPPSPFIEAQGKP